MNILYFVLLLIILALVYMYYETTRLKISRVCFTESKEPFKIVHMSDLHIKFLNVDINKVVKVLETEKPDLVVLTGDYIDNPKHIPAFIKFLESIKGNYKICLCFGNHDYKALKNSEDSIQEFKQLIEEKGVSVLLNSSVCIEKGNRKYNVIGIEDLRSKRYDVKRLLPAAIQRPHQYSHIAQPRHYSSTTRGKCGLSFVRSFSRRTDMDAF